MTSTPSCFGLSIASTKLGSDACFGVASTRSVDQGRHVTRQPLTWTWRTITRNEALESLGVQLIANRRRNALARVYKVALKCPELDRNVSPVLMLSETVLPKLLKPFETRRRALGSKPRITRRKVIASNVLQEALEVRPVLAHILAADILLRATNNAIPVLVAVSEDVHDLGIRERRPEPAKAEGEPILLEHHPRSATVGRADQVREVASKLGGLLVRRQMQPARAPTWVEKFAKRGKSLVLREVAPNERVSFVGARRPNEIVKELLMQRFIEAVGVLGVTEERVKQRRPRRKIAAQERDTRIGHFLANSLGRVSRSIHEHMHSRSECTVRNVAE